MGPVARLAKAVTAIMACRMKRARRVAKASCPSPTCAGCSTAAVNWTTSTFTCNASATAGSHGTTRNVSDSATPNVGSASFQCDDGTWDQLSGSCKGPVVTAMGWDTCPQPKCDRLPKQFDPAGATVAANCGPVRMGHFQDHLTTIVAQYHSVPAVHCLGGAALPTTAA